MKKLTAEKKEKPQPDALSVNYVEEAARELGGGNIDAAPCRRGPQESACDWCPFASACWFDEKRDKPRYLQKTTPEEFWQALERRLEHG